MSIARPCHLPLNEIPSSKITTSIACRYGIDYRIRRWILTRIRDPAGRGRPSTKRHCSIFRNASLLFLSRRDTTFAYGKTVDDTGCLWTHMCIASQALVSPAGLYICLPMFCRMLCRARTVILVGLFAVRRYFACGRNCLESE